MQHRIAISPGAGAQMAKAVAHDRCTTQPPTAVLFVAAPTTPASPIPSPGVPETPTATSAPTVSTPAPEEPTEEPTTPGPVVTPGKLSFWDQNVWLKSSTCKQAVGVIFQQVKDMFRLKTRAKNKLIGQIFQGGIHKMSTYIRDIHSRPTTAVRRTCLML